MDIDVLNKEKQNKIAIINTEEVIIKNVDTALDFMMNIQYENDCSNIIINKGAFSEDFFDLSTKIAGEVLQKFVNYDVRIAIVGDFSVYNSKSLNDFIFECNNGKNIFFVKNNEAAIEKLSV